MKKLLILAALGACGGDLDPPWQLDHDRIVAVRATPPGIVFDEESEIDALIAVKGGPTMTLSPELVTVLSPPSLAGQLRQQDGKWFVAAPDEAQLAPARQELGLGPTDPVPLELGVSYAGGTLIGLKSVKLGISAVNPTLSPMTINAAPAPSSDVEIVVGSLIDVPLEITALETEEINWMTSCGTMHDFDLPKATLRVEEDDPLEGELAVVLRDEVGGVTWQVWKIHADPPPLPAE
ncbi:MAG: hypothetical protein ABI867_32255 [Kofleriaceae bacterium]